MAIKRKKGGGGGGANWMDTYGDMVTLLLCFFVLLYSMSTISEENWKALVMSFNPSAVMEIRPTPEGTDGPVADPSDGQGLDELQAAVDVEMDEIYEALVALANQAEDSGSISVSKEGGRVFISFSDTVFFAGDSAALLPEAKPVLDEVSAILTSAVDSIDEVQVLGHTAQGRADQANNPTVDRTLSSMRATNVVIYVQENSEIDPARLVSVGVGQWRPVASNDTPEERAKNRRVEMIISGRNIAEEMSGEIDTYYTTEESAT